MKYVYVMAICGAMAIGVPGIATLAAEGDALQKLVDDLDALLDKGEKERLIDPWFLRDLRGVINKYHYPWRKQLLFDDFSGQESTPPPPWAVTAGEFLIDWRHGLRSVVSVPMPAAQSPAQEAAKKQSSEEAAAALVSKLLTQALGGQQTQSESPQHVERPATEPGYAAITAEVPMTNAFATELALSSRPTEAGARGSLEFGPYQGVGRSAGYRLIYMPARSPSLSLVAFSPSGTSMIESYNEPLNLADGTVHKVVWTRDSSGGMSIAVDGEELIRVTDRRFRDRFDGYEIVNRGGDYALRQIQINGVQ